MKTINLLILIALIIIPVTFGIMYVIPNPIPHSTLEIHGMKDSYTVGETYSFYYTLEGFGRTCHSVTVSYPDHDGKIMGWGADRDCNVEIQNKEFFYDSREHEFHHNSLVPQIPGIYKVSVHVENTQPAIFEFRVLPDTENEQPLKINVTRGAPQVEYPKNSWHNNQMNDTDLQSVIDSCTTESPQKRMRDGLKYTNETHVFSNLGCEWKKIGIYLGEKENEN